MTRLILGASTHRHAYVTRATWHDQGRDDDAHEAAQLEQGRCEPEDPYQHAAPGSPYSDD